MKEIYKIVAEGYDIKNKTNLVKNKVMVEKDKNGRHGMISLERTTEKI